jgi:hypothetical protein
MGLATRLTLSKLTFLSRFSATRPTTNGKRLLLDNAHYHMVNFLLGRKLINIDRRRTSLAC